MKNALLFFLCLTSQIQLVAQWNKGLNTSLEKNTNIPGSRIALLVGNAQYQHTTVLVNPLNDVAVMEKTLRQLGFDILRENNLNLEGMNEAMDRFTREIEAKQYEVALFYYSGHGLEHNGINFLVPIDAKVSQEADINYRCVSATHLLAKMAEAKASTKLLFLDACRDNSFKIQKKSGSSGDFAPMSAFNNTYIAFATSPGGVALDGMDGNSPFTAAMVKFLPEPGLELNLVFNRVKEYTQKQASRLGTFQIPVTSSSFSKDFYFVPVKINLPDQDADGFPDATDECPSQYGVLKGCPDSDKDGVPDHLDRCPFEPGGMQGCPAQSYIDPLVGSMVYVKGGSFTLGCLGSEYDCYADEYPVSQVTVDDFFIGQFEVTQELWSTVMGSNPSVNKNCPKCPVESVSWVEVNTFIDWLVKYTGEKYRLPTEAEWEYAARAGGKKYLFGNGRDLPIGVNYKGSAQGGKTASAAPENASGKPVPVGSLNLPNELGIHDMSGNIAEWCSDWYGKYSSASGKNPQGVKNSKLRVIRGGSWNHPPRSCRSTNRYNAEPDVKSSTIGFRLAKSL